MYKILYKETFSPGVHLMRLEAPRIAKGRKPGQFVIIRTDDRGERIPLTMTGSDLKEGSISIVFQEVGKSTMQLGAMKAGDEILDVAGPLGNPTHIGNMGKVVCIGGGLGIAPIFPITGALKDAGNRIITILGARSKNLLIMEKDMRAVSHETFVTTDDGSYGRKGFVTDALKEVIAKEGKIDHVVAIGPVPMMKAVVGVTKPANIPTLVSLNPIMVDGTGMCGVCRVTVAGKMKFACVDGPEFDGLNVDFDELTKRLRTYASDEKHAVEKYKCSACASK